jgi:hypothetical protein
MRLLQVTALLNMDYITLLQEPYLEELKPELTEEEFKKFVEPVIQVSVVANLALLFHLYLLLCWFIMSNAKQFYGVLNLLVNVCFF